MLVLDYPIFLSLAYLLLVGYLGRTIFIACRLPGAVGVLFAGWAFAAFMQPEILASRDVLQELAFFLVLLTAGFEISLKDINFSNLVMGFLPVTVELCGLAGFAMWFLSFSWIEALIMGTCFCALGDGLVIPKMKEYSVVNPMHPLPRMVFCCAPLECCFVLTIFGVLSGLAHARDEVETAPYSIALANVLRIGLTMGVGALLGVGCAEFLPRRTKLRIFRRQVFTGATVEAFLVVIAVALGGFALGMQKEEGGAFVPIFLTSGTALQAELLVIVFGTIFASRVDEELLHSIESTLGGVWVFGQIILFSMLGSKTSLEPFKTSSAKIFPVMMVGFLFRIIGVVLGMWLTRSRRTCAIADCGVSDGANKKSFWYDVLFVFLCSLPRATIQGALASLPKRNGWFSNDSTSGKEATQLISDGGRLYIVFLAIVGMILLDRMGKKILRASTRKASEDETLRIKQKGLLRKDWRQVFNKRQKAQCDWKEHLNQFEVYSYAQSDSTKSGGSIISHESLGASFDEAIRDLPADVTSEAEILSSEDAMLSQVEPGHSVPLQEELLK